jgi:hypothetical protein
VVSAVGRNPAQIEFARNPALQNQLLQTAVFDFKSTVWEFFTDDQLGSG